MMSPNRRIALNIIATYGRSLYALVIGLFCGRWVLMALGVVGFMDATGNDSGGSCRKYPKFQSR